MSWPPPLLPDDVPIVDRDPGDETLDAAAAVWTPTGGEGTRWLTDADDRIVLLDEEDYRDADG